MAKNRFTAATLFATASLVLACAVEKHDSTELEQSTSSEPSTTSEPDSSMETTSESKQGTGGDDDDDDDDDTSPVFLRSLTILPDATVKATVLGSLPYGMQVLAVDALDGDPSLDLLVSQGQASYAVFGGQDVEGALVMEKIADVGGLRQALTIDLDIDGDLDVLGIARLPGFSADCLVMIENEGSQHLRAHVAHQGKSCAVEARWLLTADLGASQGVVVVAINGSVDAGAEDFVTTFGWREGWQLERLSSAKLTHDSNHYLPQPLAAAFTDLDGDGRKDIAVGHRYNGYSYPKGQPDPGSPGLHLSVFPIDDKATITTNRVSSELWQAAIPGTFVDFDGNGAFEYVFQDRSKLIALKNNGVTPLDASEVLVEQPLHEAKCEGALGTVDADGDGVLELVTRRCILKQGANGYEIVTRFEAEHEGGSLLSVHDGAATIYTLSQNSH